MRNAFAIRCFDWIALSLALFNVAFAGGCRESGLDRVEVHGRVALDGKPIENGEIRFSPLEGTVGPISGAPIVDGGYRVDQRGGVPVGRHRVQIEGYRPGNPNLPPGHEDAFRLQYVPERYNAASELEVDVLGDASELELNFEDLSS